MRKTHGFYIEHWMLITIGLIIYDFITISFSYFFGLWLRFDFEFTTIPVQYLAVFYKMAIPYAILSIIIYWYFRLYRSVWRFASYSELSRITISSFLCGILNFAITRFFGARMPYFYHIVGLILQFFFSAAIRFSYRFVLLIRAKKNENRCNNVMLIGAGNAGQTIIRDINKNPNSDSKVVCIIDDNSNKIGRFIEGIPVVGGRDDILENVKKYDVKEIYYAIPSSTSTQKRDILNICKETECEIKVLPGLYQIANGDVSINMMKHVAIEDLLGRDSIKVNEDEIFAYLKGKKVLVTGGGGSIGSELCRQIASHEPEQLVIFDIYENNAYEIEQELKRKYKGKLNLVVLIGSVRDSKRLDNVFANYRPDVVYHAAAHKHVPLMETSPCEAIKNNVMGTYKTAYAALKYGVKRFVLISTDKAVNPTNAMGASKRLCEMVIQTFDKLTRNGMTDKLSIVEDVFAVKSDDVLANRTEYVAVRFGNVLGSNGSVIPLFKKQIEEGGPVTVTHPDIIRYFMTIPEAVSLVLQAGYYAKGGEIFVLDMGDPVKIDTLARNLIKLSGLKPDEDIEIVYTGLRPGEKLYEEKLMDAEGNRKTENDLIYIGMPIELNEDQFLRDLVDLYRISMDNDPNVVHKIAEMVPTYKPKREV